jgi:hypothetical protein
VRANDERAMKVRIEAVTALACQGTGSRECDGRIKKREPQTVKHLFAYHIQRSKHRPQFFGDVRFG